MRARTGAVMLGLLAAAAAGCGDMTALLAGAERAEGTFTRSIVVSGPINLDVATGSGSVVVRGGADGRLLVEGRVVARGRSAFGGAAGDPEEQVRRLVAHPPVQQTGNTIRIGPIDDADLRRNVSISYTVTVPADTSLASRTGSGSQNVEGIEGPATVTTGSGSIHLRGVGGAVRAATGSGSITAVDVGGAFEARTGSGSIDGTGVAGPVTVKTGSGRIRVVQTRGGDVEATAGSGSIDLSGVRGGIRASSGSGSLSVRGEQTAEWRLETSSGNVDVEIDGTPAFDLDAQGSRVESTYPMTVTGSISRRTVRGSVNGGGPLLRVRTSSGRVSIR